MTFKDNATLEQNLAIFSAELVKLNGRVGPQLVLLLPHLIDGAHDKEDVLDQLLSSITSLPVPANAGTAPHTAAAMPTLGQPDGWLLESIEIEGFRGINNEGSLTYKNLDDATRVYMSAEVQADAAAGSLYISPRLSEEGVAVWPALLGEAVSTKNDAWLATEISNRGLLKSHEERRNPKGGTRSGLFPTWCQPGRVNAIKLARTSL